MITDNVYLRHKAIEITLWDFPIHIRNVVSTFLNSDNLVPLSIYVFDILSITILIAFIWRRVYIIIFSIELILFFSFYQWSYIYVKNKF